MELAKLEFEAADKHLSALLAEHPLVLNYLDIRAALLSNRGVQLVLQDDFAAAETVLLETIRLQEQVVTRQPEAFGNYNNLCNMYNSLGAALSNQRKYQEAEVAIRRGIEINAKGREMAAERVSVDFFGLNLKTGLANSLVAQRNYVAASEILKDVEPAIKLLVANNPTSPQYRITAIGGLRSSAISQLMLGQIKTASIAAQDAIQEYDKLPPPYQKAWTVKKVVTDAALTLARCQLQENQLEAAKKSLQRVFTLVDSVLSDAEVLSFRLALFRGSRGEAYHLEGKICAAQNQSESVDANLVKAIEDQRFLVDSLAGLTAEASRPARESLAEYYIEHARTLLKLQRTADSISACRAAISLETKEESEADAILTQIQLAEQCYDVSDSQLN